MNENIKLKKDDVIRLNSPVLDKGYGIGIVRFERNIFPNLYKVDFQNGLTCDVYLVDCRVIANRNKVFNHCQNILDCAINPVDDPNCGLQDNYCNDDKCDCSICPFNRPNPMKHPTCIEDGFREAWFYESDAALVDRTKSVINFLNAPVLEENSNVTR